jgi:undecaprenyl-diphosphatase
VGIAAAGCLAGFGFAARGSSRPLLFDRSIDSFLARTPGPGHSVAVVLSNVGDPRIFVTITGTVVIVLVLLKDYRAAVATVAAVALALVLVEEVLKPFFDRRMGDLSGPTFPSGHTAVSVALAGAVILAAGRARPLGRLLKPAARRVLMCLVVLVACSIGLAMVVLHLHYMSDVVTGVPLGFAVSGCVAAVLDAIAGRAAGK